MNLKWMIDGVSNHNLLWPFCCPNILILTCRTYIRGDSAQPKVCRCSLCRGYRLRAYVNLGLIKQLADVGTALSWVIA
jgi:hypothetical protein